MRAFDHSQPCGEVMGMPGVHWEQNGVLYNLQYHPIRTVDGRPLAELPLEAPADDGMTIAELREHAKVYGVENYQKMNRKELERALNL